MPATAVATSAYSVGTVAAPADSGTGTDCCPLAPGCPDVTSATMTSLVVALRPVNIPFIGNVYGFAPATHDWNVPVAVQGTLTCP